MSYQQWIDLAGQPYRDALRRDAEIAALRSRIEQMNGNQPSDLDTVIAQRDAEIAALRAQIEQYIADALVRAHRQCIALDALLAIRSNTALPAETRLIAARALTEIEGVKP